MKQSGFNLIHRTDLLQIIDSIIEAARLAGANDGVVWLLIVRKAFER